MICLCYYYYYYYEHRNGSVSQTFHSDAINAPYMPFKCPQKCFGRSVYENCTGCLTNLKYYICTNCCT